MSLALLLLAFALLALAGSIELWWGAAARERLRATLEHAERQLASAAAGAAAAPPPRAADARKAPSTALRPWEAWQRRAHLPAGWRTPLLLALPGVLLAMLAASRLGTPWAAPLAFATYAVLVWIWLRRRIEARQQRLLRQMPDFLDNMVRLAGIGNSLPMAFQTAAQHAPMPLRALLDATLVHTRNGLDLDRALHQAAQPYRIRAFEVLSVVLGTSIRIGGRADQVLQRMSDFIRDQEQAERELQATTSETRTSAWVLGLLPPLCALAMALLSPEFFRPMTEQPLGHRILLIAFALEAVGALLLYRLARSI